jgi:hypothetical protein
LAPLDEMASLDSLDFLVLLVPWAPRTPWPWRKLCFPDVLWL